MKNINSKLLVELVCRFFKNVYLMLSLTSLLFMCLGLGYISYYNPPAVYNFIEQCSLIFIETILFFIWFRIFVNLIGILDRNETVLIKPNFAHRISSLLVVIFVIQFLENCLYVFIPDLVMQRDWSAVNWPDANLKGGEYFFGVYFFVIKVYHYWKPFLLPNVEGIGALILALIMYSMFKNFPDFEETN